MVELAHEIGAGLWLKPLEIHSAIHQKYSIEKKDLDLFRKMIAMALARADELGVRIVLREFLEATISDVSPSDLYQTISCTIGFTYIRFEVDGTVKPCCGTPVRFGNINESKLNNIWHSDQYYSWRSKFLRIQETSFHLKDKEFGFCQTCPHSRLNIKSSKQLLAERG